MCQIWYQNKFYKFYEKNIILLAQVVLDMSNAIKRGSSFYAASRQQWELKG